MNTQLLAVFFSIILLSSISCTDQVVQEDYFIDEKTIEVETAKEVEILYSDSARVRVRITGPTMLRHTDLGNPQQEFPDGVKVDFFDQDETIKSILTSKYALRLENKGKVIAKDSVVWKSVEDEMLETSELIWDERQEKVYTNKFVVITRPDEIIYSHGFEANQDFSDLKLTAIDGRMKIEDLEQNEASSDQ